MTLNAQLQRHGLFDARVPRYTSYPPANHFGPFVNTSVMKRWLGHVAHDAQISLYIHIPFCRRLCWFCACRTQGIKTDSPLSHYVDTVRKELAMVKAEMPEGVTLSRLHLGGGTPTILPPALMTRLLSDVFETFELTKNGEFSVEIDPTEIDEDRLEVLTQFGMNRASIGVQDFDPKVQAAIGRPQSFAQTKWLSDALQARGVCNLNMDVLYGLPHQNWAELQTTLRQVADLRPSRIAMFGYAHVPWMSKRQAMIPEDALPDPHLRLEHFDRAAAQLNTEGYQQIGIDHFALPHDSLAKAAQSGALTRNFQGYTDDTSDVLIGLGASSISKFPQGLAQNGSATIEYSKAINEGRLATKRGYMLNRYDKITGDIIEALMCHFKCDAHVIHQKNEICLEDIRAVLAKLHDRFADVTTFDGTIFRIPPNARALTRIIVHGVDQFTPQDKTHSIAI
ncbi:UNVERIFIED_CONTAM: hypothetical protein GTU68_055348 [Idotea baltica]|nr:hypothetical protein [Idotea baltica]